MTERNVNWGSYRLGAWSQRYLSMCHAMPTGKLMRRLTFWLRKPLKMVIGEEVDVVVWGLKLRLKSKGNLSEQRLIFMPQFLDHDERQLLRDEIQDGEVFLDIGANVGAYSLWMASQKEKNLRIEAFEPDDALCRRLSFNIEQNQLNNLYLRRIALGREEGEVVLVKGVGNSGENQVVSASEHGERIRMCKLSTFLEENGIPRVHCMKIDVEGMENEILEPYFLETKATDLPRMIVCEVLAHAENSALIRLLERSGYRLQKRCRMNGVFVRA